MWFAFLGPLEAHQSERQIDLGPPQQRAVLAVLLVEANRVVPQERLVDLLWGNDPPAQATGALQVYISGLRQALEPDQPARMRSRYLVTQPPGYLLRVGPAEADAFRFQALAGTGRSLLAEGRAAEGRAALAEALGLWRGRALAEFALKPFARREAARLEALRVVALEDRIEADLSLANHAGVVAELEFLVGEHPLRERLWALLMLALYRSERQGEALRAFSRARTTLREELGIEPGPVLRQLEEDILRQAPGLVWRGPEPGPATVSGPLTPAPSRPLVSNRGLVGRQAELRMLDRLLVEAAGGGGGLVLVSGEPGIGKTRLVEEVVARAVERSSLVVAGRCEEGGGSPSFWPWVQVIRSLLSGGDADALRRALAGGAGEIAQISPEVKELVPDFEPPTAVDPGAARLQLFEAINSLLAGMAASRPLVVVLDDLHWADVPSLRLAEFVAHRTADTGVLLVVAFRDCDPAIGGPLASTLDELARHPSLHRASLGGLSETECGVFIAETFGVEPSEAVAATVHARTDGNPFFVSELARLWASEAALSGDVPADMRVPAGVREVIRRRLSRLPTPTAEFLVLAAVLGRDIELPVLAVAGRIEPDMAVEMLDASVAAGLLVAAPGPGSVAGLRFSHALVQETILSELSPGSRARAHARAAAALRVTSGSDNDRAVQLAHHLFEAVPAVAPDEAYAAALHAAEVCQRRLAHEQAEDQLRRALVMATRMEAGTDRAHKELEVQHRLATLLSATQGYHSDGVAAAWNRARELSRELGDTPEVLNSVWGLARLTRSRAQFGVSVMFGEELLDLAKASVTGPRGPNPVAPLFALAGHEALGMAALFTGSIASAVRHLSETVALCDAAVEEGSDRQLVLQPAVACRSYLACALWLQGDDEAADRLSGKAWSLAEASGHRLSQAIAALYAAKLASMRGRAEEAAEWTNVVARLASGAPIGPLEAIGELLGAWAQAQLGDPDDAAAGFSRAMAGLRLSGWRLAMSYFLALEADVHRAAGRLDLALAAAERGLVEAEATGERYYEAELCRLLGELTAAIGHDAEPAEPAAPAPAAWMRRAIATARRQGATAFLHRAELGLARLGES